MKNIYYLLIFSLSVQSYAQKDPPVPLDLPEAINNAPKEILLSEIASDIQYIPLETNENCLVVNNYDIRYTGGEIFVGSEEHFYHFDKSGNFLNKIGQKGNGPEDYTMGLFYFVDARKKYFYTHDWTTTACYTFDGKFVRKIKTPELNMGVAEVYNKDYILYSNDNYYARKDKPLQLFIIDSIGKPVSQMAGVIEKNKKYGINLSTRDFMYIFDGNTYFKPAFENVVYKIISPSKKEIAWKFEMGKKDIDVARNETGVNNRMKSISVFQLKETSKYLFILYGLDNKIYSGLYDKVRKTLNNVIIKDDLSGGIDIVPAGKCEQGYIEMAYFPKSIYEGKKYGKASLPNRKKELDNILLNYNEENNPILILIELR